MDSNNIKQDNTFILKIENHGLPVELKGFCNSLSALNELYVSFLKTKNLNRSENLFVKEITKGSIIVEITSMVFDSIDKANTLIQFAIYLKALKLFFEKDKVEANKIIKESGFSTINKHTIRLFKNFINIKTNTKDTNITINITIKGENISIDPKDISKNVERELNKISQAGMARDR